MNRNRYNKKNINTQLKMIRIAKDISPEYMASNLRISAKTYWSIENAKISPRLDIAYAIAKLLNESVLMLFPIKRKYVKD